jgi:hypothetical protein
VAAEEVHERIRDLDGVREGQGVVGATEQDVVGLGKPREEQVPDLALSARTQDWTVTSCSSEPDGYR